MMEYDKYFEDFKNDSVYSEFFNENFHLQNAIAKINNLPFNEKISKISSGIDYIKSTISKLTSTNCETYFRLTTKLDEFCEELRSICTKSQNLNKTLEGMRAKVETPHQQLSKEIILLERLQQTCDLLRKMLRIMHLMERIEESKWETLKQDQSFFMKEIVKLSQYISEIDSILGTNSGYLLVKLVSLNKIMAKFLHIKNAISTEANLLLTDGLEKFDLNEIGVALQMFFNLGLLNEKLNDLLQSKHLLLDESSNKLTNNLDCNENNPNIPLSKQNNLIKTRIRSSCKAMMETIYINFNQLSTIMKILKKKRDNQTQTLLIDSVIEKDIVTVFWDKIINQLTLTFNKFFYNSPVIIKKIIESDYPKILAIFIEYWNKILHIEPDIINEKTLRSTIDQFENAYLSNSLSLLFESVNRIFSNVEDLKNRKHASIPSEKDIDSVIKNINNEFLAASFDTTLTESICRNIMKTIGLFMNKCEYLVSHDGDSTQVIAKFTANQRHNARIVHILNYFSDQLKNFIQNDSVPDSFKQNITESLIPIDNLILNIIEPFLISIQEAIEDIILTIHNEKYNIDSKTIDEQIQCSLYMKELQGFLLRVSQDYFQQFPNADVIKTRIHQMTAFVTDFFLLHNCLIRPVSEMGRKRLSVDFTQFENAISPICQRFGDVGRSFQILKAFKTLLFLSPEEIATSTIIGDPVPYYLVVHFLIANYASNEVLSPHKFKDWSISRYSKWITDKKLSNSDKLSIVKNSLNDYAIEVKKSQKKTFIPIYPILTELIGKGE